MGCRDRESNFQYTFWDPEKHCWYCKHGYSLVYAAPRGHERLLADKLVREETLPGWKWFVRYNRQNRMWEATIRKSD